MKKTALLNIALSELIASLGHGDLVVVGDAGLPVPSQTRRIDLSLTPGVPSFVETVRAMLGEMQVESAIVAEETGKVSPHILDAIRELMPDVPLKTVPHPTLKDICMDARAVVRTGEFTPYANVILVAGVVF